MSRSNLQDEIAAVLRENATGSDSSWMSISDIAEAVARRGNYVRPDGKDVRPSQIAARVASHPEQFERRRSDVRLKSPPDKASDEPTPARVEPAPEFSSIASAGVPNDRVAAAHGLLWELEISLFDFVEGVLKKHFESDENAWWYEGVPREVRVKAAERHESDGGRGPKERFLDLSDLPNIMKSQWKVFRPYVDPTQQLSKDNALAGWGTVINVRKRVMHALRGHTAPLTDEEIELLTKKRDEAESLVKSIKKANEG